MNRDLDLSSATSSSNLIKCSNCSFRGPQTDYPLKVNGLGYVKTCHGCTKKAAEHNAKSRARQKEKQGAAVTQPLKKSSGSKQVPQPWSSIAPKLAKARGKPCEVDVFLDLDPSHPAADLAKPDNERAAALIADIRRETGYSFNYLLKTQLTEQACSFRYNCAQRDGAQTKPKTHAEDPDLQRDRDYMTRFACGGSLRITLNDAEPLRPRIRFVHQKHHIPWVDISPSDEIKAYIIENKVLGPARLWKEIQRKWPETEIEEAQVYNHWGKASEADWKLDPDQVKSAKMLVERAAGKEVEVIAMHAEPGMASIGFALKEPLELWGEETAEIAFDGTFNTNSANYEISGLVAEGHGQGVPIGFIYTTATDGTAKTGAKLRLLVNFLEFFRERCPRIMFTLTDKERAEIDAFRKVWPKAKHQCCYWHAIRYLETRLSENKPPAPYDPREAWKEFDFIDPTWAPGVFANADDAVNEKESGSAKPRTEADEQAEIEDG
ncbi:hypothetical protein FRC00_004714 [Tulasnella sp. 408]|nr:hypothetical protein FRC00_004714 [Tulasnella sp. 408]